MPDVTQPENSPSDRSSPAQQEFTFQRILELTEQVCLRFENKHLPVSLGLIEEEDSVEIA
jgi:hypothetical protein